MIKRRNRVYKRFSSYFDMKGCPRFIKSNVDAFRTNLSGVSQRE